MGDLASDVRAGLRTVPARAGLVFLSLFIGFFAVTLLVSTLEALQRRANDLVAEFGAGSFALIRPPGAEVSSWSREKVTWFRDNLDGDAAVSGLSRLETAGQEDLAVVAADGDLARVRGWRFADGRALDALDVRQAARHAVAPAALCRRRGWRVGEFIRIGREPFRLVGGIAGDGAGLPSLPAAAVYIPYTVDALDEGAGPARHRVEAIWFRADGGTDPEALQRRVAALLDQPGASENDAVWITPETLLQGIRRWQKTIAWTAGSGSLLGLLLGAVTLAGLLLTGVRERIPEIGLRRALGARRRDIAGLFVAEALVLTVTAGLAGWAAGELTLRWLGSRFPLPFHLGWQTRLLPLLLAVGLALLCSIGPAVFAARLPPAEALRNE
ncbi:MAG: ABC transporter permease [Kiritimatiellae bacterium]|nr:ABC transporter permease [Kiritimatiellia bacterium]MDD3440728.1 ABC transporter permease [Kiritimatiellia bacterium]HPC57403.1 ABC transporter permease [Kiritimatiellia bacterium]